MSASMSTPGVILQTGLAGTVLPLRNEICKILPISMKIRNRLLQMSSMESLISIGNDVLQVLTPDMIKHMKIWEFVAQYALCLESSNLPLCQSILTGAMEKTDRHVCFGGYLYVLTRYTNICLPEVWTGDKMNLTSEYVGILEEAHALWLERAHECMVKEPMAAFMSAQAHVTVLKYLVVLHCLLKNTEKVITFGDEFYEASQSFILTMQDSQGVVGMLCNQSYVLPILIDQCRERRNFEKAIQSCERLQETWQKIIEYKTKTPQTLTVEEISLGVSTSLVLKGELLLQSGKADKALDYAVKNVPTASLKLAPSSDHHKECLLRYFKLIEGCADHTVGTRCARCQKEAHTRCTGCVSVLYCSRVCQKADWKGHAPSCGITPKRQFGKLLQNLINAMYKHTFSNEKTEKLFSDNPGYNRIQLFGGFSTVILECSSAYGQIRFGLVKCTSRLLEKQLIDQADPLLTLLSSIGCMTILPAYMNILKGEWRKVVEMCNEYSLQYSSANKERKSLAPTFFASIALFHLGYPVEAQRDYRYVYSSFLDQKKKASSSKERESAEGLIKAYQDLLVFLADAENVFPKKKQLQCFFCEKQNSGSMKLKKCNVCDVARYCNEQCQKKDWEFHKTLCRKSSGPDLVLSKDSKRGERAIRKGMRKIFPEGLREIDLSNLAERVREGDASPDTLAEHLKDVLSGVSSAEKDEVAQQADIKECGGCCAADCLLRCSRCKVTWYCCVACQTAHWKKDHKKQCVPK